MAARRKTESLASEVDAPKQVFDAFCARIANAFARDGFRYAKTRHALGKKVDDLEFAISFATSHRNVAGAHVDFNLIVAVHSSVLAAWRAEHLSLGHADRVAGGMFHRLRGEATPIHWELAPANTRDAVADEVERAVRDIALPWLESFRDRKGLVARVKTQAVPAFDLVDAVDVALCFGTAHDARAVLDAFVARGDAWRADVPRAENDLAALPALRNA